MRLLISPTLAVLSLLVAATSGGAQQGPTAAEPSVSVSAPRPTTRAGTRVGEIRIDGRLDDAGWEGAPVTTGFVQIEPNEGEPPSHDTEVRVLFDDEAMYVGARMWDNPDSITRVLVRRDERGAFMDWFGISIDPERDGRTAYQFKISAAGSQQDIYISDDTQEDMAWNAVWESATTIDSLGWILEVRLPLSQIRYESGSPQSWGINFHRRRSIIVEMSSFSLESRGINGTVSQYGTIEGVRVPVAGRRIEARPYVLSSLHNGPSEPGDPFFDGNDVGARVGSDFRLGLGSSFTLDATVNPDFGQVDGDPAVINLGAFETRFDERRPFFVEDAQVFDFGLSGGSNQLYYSRRIGRSPHGSGPSNADFSEVPDAATIVGAAKVTGRTTGGLSLGALAAVTKAEEGEAFFASDGSMREFRAEPRSEFGVLTARQDFRGGLSQVGVIATGMHRTLPADRVFDDLPDQAYTAGVRFDHQWGPRRGWKLNGFLAGSRVLGEPEAIVAIQRSSVHYFQRPDATRARVDSSATSIAGAEWRLQLDRQNTDHWTGSVWTAGVTKGFEVNDLGFSTTRERIDGGARVGYRELRPGPVFRDYNLGLFTVYNFSWEALDDWDAWRSWRRAYTNGNFSFNANGTFRSYRGASLNLSFNPDRYSRSGTRGGPVMIEPGGVHARIGFNTDRRRSTSLNGNVSYTAGSRESGDDWSVSANLTMRPQPNIQVTLRPEFSVSRDAAQYVTSTSAIPYQPTFGRRYLFGDLEQKQVGLEVRTDYTLSPALSFQLYVQPLLSSGDYSAYRQLRSRSSYDFEELREGRAPPVAGPVAMCVGGAICRQGDQQMVDFDGNGLVDYSFDDRDFNVRSLIGNAVLRWEYRPGSTIFLVWQRQQESEVGLGDFDFGRDVDALWGSPAHNRFIVKVNYWLGL